MRKALRASKIGMPTLAQVAVANVNRNYKTLSSDIFLKDNYLETYWRGKLLRFDYDILRKNDMCIDVFHTASGGSEQAQTIPRTRQDAIPILAIRSNDTIDIDWDDDTCSTLNLTRLIEQQMERDEDNWGQQSLISAYTPSLVDPELNSILRELSESGYSLATFEDEQNDICEVLKKIATFTEQTNFIETHHSVKEALPNDHNGLAVLHASHEMTVELINAKKYAAAFREKHPKYFETLCQSPCIRSDDFYPNNTCQKVIAIGCETVAVRTADIEEQIEEIRFGDLDPIACSDYVRKAYRQFRTDMWDTEILSTDEIVERVTLPPNAALLVDCTQAWYKSEHMKNRAPREELQVDNCLLSNDNWKSTARGLAM